MPEGSEGSLLSGIFCSWVNIEQGNGTGKCPVTIAANSKIGYNGLKLCRRMD